MAVDALGNPLRCLLSAGQLSDVTHAQALIEGFKADAVLGDKAYDANALLEYLAQHNIQAVIPPKANRVEQRECHRHMYKDRNLVERLFARLKQFRRIAHAMKNLHATSFA